LLNVKKSLNLHYCRRRTGVGGGGGGGGGDNLLRDKALAGFHRARSEMDGCLLPLVLLPQQRGARRAGMCTPVNGRWSR